MTESKTPAPQYSEYYTRLKRITIPLTNYHMFHKVSDVDNDNLNFIERSGTSEQLKKWLRDDDMNVSGSYLITGYRGMGKSSFVGKVVRSLEKEERPLKTLYIVIYLLGFFLPILLFNIPINKLFILPFAICSLGMIGCMWAIKNEMPWKKPKSERYIHYIKINIGNEIHNERDILAILSTSIADKVKKYIHRELPLRSSYLVVFFFKVFFFSLFTSCIFGASGDIIEPLFKEFQNSKEPGFFITLVTSIGKVFIFSDAWWAFSVKVILSALISYALCFKLLEPLVLKLLQLFYNELENPHTILRRLESLIDRIDASMAENTNSDVPASTYFSINLGANRRKVYQQASVREIEYELSQIINDFQQSRLLNNRFIIVFDELDKLDTSQNEVQKSEKTEKEMSPFFSHEEFSSDSDTSPYDRQHYILKFLGRLKYFTTNAKAKFVFIAGHELYDAYLADVSDREYAISSMFNGVLNLKSFLSSKPLYKNISRMTESFLCKALVNLDYLKRGNCGENALDIAVKRLEAKRKAIDVEKWIHWLTGWRTINIWSRYVYLIPKEIESKLPKTIRFLPRGVIPKDIRRIDKRVSRLEAGDFLNDGGDDDIYTLQNVVEEFRTMYCEYFRANSPEQCESVFHLLQQFVTYLTLTSNGAPKKLISQLEKYVISKEKYESIHRYAGDKGDYVFFFGDGIKADYYLSFGYPDKEKIGFIHNIAQPIFSTIINSNSDYDDKLLVTSIFLVSHLYKHHGSGFSWRNLEYIPELIESNRTPELRGYIKDILITMEKMDLTSITSGIYNFKFSKSLIEEISHFSRKYEEVSAIFNFSFDYFRSVKKYFRGLLSFYGSTNEQDSHSNVVAANIYSYLGDIQMAGEEYTEAASTYRMAADIFKQAITDATKVKESNDDISLLIVRYTYAMLKLGLAYERRNTFDSAYLVYNTLTNSLIDFRHIDDHLFGFQTGIVYNRPEGGPEVNKVIMYEPKQHIMSKNSTNEEEDPLLLPQYVDEKGTDKLKQWMYGDELFSNLYFYLTPTKEQILSKLTAYEDLRIAYLSILAKLFSLEKQNMSGITRENVELAVSEFEYMYILTKMSSKYILAADFYRKLGDILYYKNLNYYTKKSWDNMFLLLSNGFNVKQLLMTVMFKSLQPKSTINNVIKWFTDDNGDGVTLIIEETEKTDTTYFWEIFKKYLKEKTYNEKLYRRFDTLFNTKFQDAIPINKINHLCLMRSMLSENPNSYIVHRPCVACRFYNKSLYTIHNQIERDIPKKLKDKLRKDTNNSQALFFLKITDYHKIFKSFRLNELKQIALTLEAMGNVMLSCAEDKQCEMSNKCNETKGTICQQHNNRLQRQNLHITLIGDIMRGQVTNNQCISKLNNLERAIIYNITASRYYEQAAEYTSMTECMHKVMQILYQHISLLDKKVAASQDYGDLMDSLEEELSRMIGIIYESKNYHITEINKFRQVVHSLDDDTFIKLGMTSMMAEIQDLIYDYYQLILLIERDQDKLKATIKSLYNAPSLRCYNNMSLANNRLGDCLFKSQLNDIVFKTIMKNDDFSKDISSFLNLNSDDNSLKVFLIADSIFCLTSAVSILSTIRTNTLFSNISYTDIYLQLIKWGKRKERLEKDDKTKQYLKKQLQLVIPDTSIETIRKSYFLKLAESHYKQALQMHSEGNAYHNMIDRFYILDDDLQNNTSQFLLALERYSLRNHNYQEDFKKLNKKIKTQKEGKVQSHDYYSLSEYIGSSC